MRPLSIIKSWPGIRSRRHTPDMMILFAAMSLVLVGSILQYAIGPALARQAGESVGDNYFFTRHMISAAIGLVGLVVGWKIPLKYWVRGGPYILAAGAVLAGMTVAIGGEASRWIQIGFFSFQPVEVVKIGFILSLAPLLAGLARTKKGLADWKSLRPILVALGLSLFVIVILQRDLGSMVVIGAVVASMLFLAGLPMRLFAIGLLASLFIGSTFIVSTPYRRDRVSTFFDSSDCSGEAYHACQALVGIGSGELIGKGLGRSVQVYGYLPEANNDSIFAIYAEVTGFVGVVVLLAIMGRMYASLYSIIKKTEPVLSLITAGILIWFSVQSTMNIGAMLGILPLKGITLPFISYGGSSLMMVLFATGIVIQISSYTIYSYESKDTTNRRRVRRTRYAAGSFSSKA